MMMLKMIKRVILLPVIFNFILKPSFALKCIISVGRITNAYNQIVTVLCLVTWQLMFTAQGIPAMCVGAVSMFTPRAVTLPPNP